MGNTGAVPQRDQNESANEEDLILATPNRSKFDIHHKRHHVHFSDASDHQHLPLARRWSPQTSKMIPTVFRWTGGGKTVALAGSFDNWKEKIPMARGHDDFMTIVELDIGTYEYKYFVDGAWTYNPLEPSVSNEFGSYNNQVTVKESDFEVFEALKADGADVGLAVCDPNSGDFTQDIPSQSPVGGPHQRRPPTLPPQLLQIILNKDNPEYCEPAILPEPDHVAVNHLYALSIKDGVMTLSSTLRYKQKYVTTLLYRPA